MPLRVGMLGSRHGHAVGKWQALRSHPEVDPAGIFEAQQTSQGHIDQFPGARWFSSAAELLEDPTLVAVAVEARNHESLALAQAAAERGKHVWLDKPAGDEWRDFEQLVRTVAERQLHMQLGYMFRYSPAFTAIEHLVRSGALGEVFAVRAHMSTQVDLEERRRQSRHRGGILFDLGGHMLDQVVWLLGRPRRMSAVLRNDATPQLPTYADNTLTVIEFEHALAHLEIAAMESRPLARRFEIFGTRGSAILEPFENVSSLRLLQAGTESSLPLRPVDRQDLYDAELAAFIGVLQGTHPAERSMQHELLVQQTLLRATGQLPSEQVAP